VIRTSIRLGLAAGAVWWAALTPQERQSTATVFPPAVEEPETVRIRLLAVGDINLGRSVGQRILHGDTLFPFASVRDTLLSYDVVLGNLESCLSDQGGETQSPRDNLVFTGPPAGAIALRKGGVQIVSTANNHALDYGLRGWSETMVNLDQAGVAFVGTSRDSANLAGPVILERRGIRIAFFACTDLMNRPGGRWKRYVASADTASLLPRIRRSRATADLVVVSYHGGQEYTERPARSTVQFARWVADAGAALFVGHHPHVPYGIERRGGSLIVHSLGNFVFRQPSRFWTQRSVALAATIVKDTLGARVEGYSVLPVLAGACPSFAVDRADRDTIYHRIRALSSPEVTEHVR
jgi:poly-gamma-glutamate capsule biosynthesis protein CapA/YwtB (metallophosphatase superfamily)